MKRIMAVLCAGMALVGACGAAKAEKSVSTGMHLYSAGTYTVGDQLEEGEYILFCAEGHEAQYLVGIDEEGLDVITEGVFGANAILTVEEGDYLQLTDCTAVLAEDFYSVSRIEPDGDGGTLKIGYDIEPGTYELIGCSDETSFYRIYDDSRFHLIAGEEEFQFACEVYLELGQYLELVNCTVGRRISGSPAPAPSEAAETDLADDAEADFLLTPASEPEKTLDSVRKVRIAETRTPVIRAIPSTKGEPLGTAEAGAEYELLEAAEKWYKIRLDEGREGWIARGMAEIVE